MDEFGADGVFHQREYEPAGRKRDEAVASRAAGAGQGDARRFRGWHCSSRTRFCPKRGRRTPSTAPTSANGSAGLPMVPCPRQRHVPVPANAQSGDTLPTAAELKFATPQTFACGGEDAAQDLLRKFLANRRSAEYDGPAGHFRGGRHFAPVAAPASRHAVAALCGGRRPARRPGQAFGEQGWRASVGAGAFVRFLGEIAWHDFYLQILPSLPPCRRRRVPPAVQRAGMGKR